MLSPLTLPSSLGAARVDVRGIGTFIPIGKGVAIVAAHFVAAIDQGTTSTRCILFDKSGHIAGHAQQEHRQYFPQPGWVEHDPAEIWRRTQDVIAEAAAGAKAKPGDIAAVGITNQRETTVVWDRATGETIYPAIVWQDTRTDEACRQLGGLGGGADRYRDRVGLPLASYFSGPKMAWILDHVDGARARAEAGELAAGTIDAFLAWNLTGGPNGGAHITDVTNASRTMLMDLRRAEWDTEICAEIRVPPEMLPEIHPSSGVITDIAGPASVAGVPLAGLLGDQHAAMFGQACLNPGDAKNTYGTGNFLLMNTGTQPVFSQHGLLTTVCYQISGQEPTYALEGSIAVTGSLIQWLRDNLGIISSADDVEALAGTVPDNGGAYIVPAFSGLFAPYWRPDARGAIVGLTRFVTKAHLARAALEATAFQTLDVVAAMNADSSAPITVLKVDGGMVANSTLMQFQADILGVPVVRPRITETTALGAAYAAGLAVGFFESVDEICAHWAEETRFEPAMGDAERGRLSAAWRKAVTRTFDWA